METLHLLGALSMYLLSLTLQPPLKGGEGRGSGKGLKSRYGEYWKLEKVFFNERFSTILQLVVASKHRSKLTVRAKIND